LVSGDKGGLGVTGGRDVPDDKVVLGPVSLCGAGDTTDVHPRLEDIGPIEEDRTIAGMRVVGAARKSASLPKLGVEF
jgi:hypothetical protein